ncbi:MAG: hemerythrin domain-containing protein [Thermoplasmata archaeon]
MKPRNLEPKELIEKLKEEHRELPALIDDTILTYQVGNLSGAFPVLVQIRDLLSQHTIDEEAVILKIILDKLNKEESEKYVDIMREHVAIMKNVDDAVESTYTGWTETVALMENLRKISAEHHRKEEEILFPKVLELL